MKHDYKISILLITFFLIAQYLGLFVVGQYMDMNEVVDPDTGVVSYNVSYKELPLNMEVPEVEGEYDGVIIVTISILIGTGIVLLLAKFRKRNVWKFWYLFSMVFIMAFVLSGFIGETIGLSIAIILACWKVFRPNIYIHNLTEMFLYSGMAILFVQLFTVPAAFALLIVISIYDAIAVWRSKHMIKLAEFQSSTNVFAGFFLPYSVNEKGKSKIISKIKNPSVKKKAKTEVKKVKHESSKEFKEKKTKKVQYNRAILGGGDIAFPLIFTSVVMKEFGFMKVSIIPPFVALSLFLLFYFGKKGKYYPAMPFISAGCLVGYFVAKFVGILFGF